MNLPNKLTFARLILIPFFMVAFYMSFTGHYLVSLAIFAVAAATDFFDGRIARKKNLITDLGKFLDPIADKVLVLAAFVVLLSDPYDTNVFKHFGDGYLIFGGVGVVIIIARELTVSTLRMMAARKGIVLAAENIGKAKTFVTDIAVIVLIFAGDFYTLVPIVGDVSTVVGLVLFGASVILTLISGISYLVKNAEVFKD